VSVCQKGEREAVVRPGRATPQKGPVAVQEIVREYNLVRPKALDNLARRDLNLGAIPLKLPEKKKKKLFIPPVGTEER